MRTRVAMYSHASRKEIREQSIRDFANVGLEPTTVRVQTEPPKQLRNRQNAWTTLKEAYGGNPVLLLEDDTYPAYSLPDWVRYLEATEDRVVTLYASARHFYPPDLLPTKKRLTPRIETIPRLRVWYGSQALWIPPNEAERILADAYFIDPTLATWEVALGREGGPWDRALREHLTHNNRTMGLAVPNVVQHRAPPSVVHRTQERTDSPTFDAHARPPESPTEAAQAPF